MSDEHFDDSDLDEASEEDREEKRKEILSIIAGYCIQKNFKFDVISPKRWLTLTFESRNEKQDQGIDVFIDVRKTEDLYFVVPAAYDVLIDEEIPAVVKAVNINNNYVNPARCSFSEKSRKVIVDYTYPILDGEITLEQFTRILMFVLESAEALRDNISKAQKKIDRIEESEESKIPYDMTTSRKPDTKKYLKKRIEFLSQDIEDKPEANKLNDISNKFGASDTKFNGDTNTAQDDDENNLKDDGIKNSNSIDEMTEEEEFGNKLKNFFEEVVKNLESEDDESENEELIENENFAAGFNLPDDNEDQDDEIAEFDDDIDDDQDYDEDDDRNDDFNTDYL